MSDPTACVRLTGVTKKFGAVLALDSVSLGVARGSFTTLLGPSGCGKTTLLRLIAGFYEPDAGEIFLDEKKVNGLPPYKRNTPLVFQDYALFPHMTVFENVAYGLRLKKVKRDAVRRKVAEMLALFNLEGLEKRFPRQLSGGQQQRVAFARVLIMGSGILLLDEPLSNLDAKLRVEVRGELKNIQKRFGITMIYVTHDQEEALAMSDKIAVMNQGRIIQEGAPEEIYSRPGSRFVADFIGAVNLLPAAPCAAPGEAEVLGVRVGADGRPAEGRSFAVLRPESIALSAPSDGCLKGRVVDRVFLGRIVRYRVLVGEQTLSAEALNGGETLAPGTEVGVRFDRTRLHIIS